MYANTGSVRDTAVMYSNYQTCFEMGGEAFNSDMRLAPLDDEENGDYIPDHDMMFGQEENRTADGPSGTMRFDQIREHDQVKDEKIDFQRAMELREKQTQQFMQMLERTRKEGGGGELKPIDSRAE